MGDFRRTDEASVLRGLLSVTSTVTADPESAAPSPPQSPVPGPVAESATTPASLTIEPLSKLIVTCCRPTPNDSNCSKQTVPSMIHLPCDAKCFRQTHLVRSFRHECRERCAIRASRPMVLALVGAMMSRNALTSGLSLVFVSEPDASAFRLIKCECHWASALPLTPHRFQQESRRATMPHNAGPALRRSRSPSHNP